MSSKRIDEETGDIVRPGCMTQAEYREWAAESRRRWQAALCGAEPPEPEGWVLVASVGWVRRARPGKGR